MKIFLIDDDVALLGFLKKNLVTLGHYIKVSNDFKQSMAILEEESFDCIVCDYLLSKKEGEKTGLSLLKTLRSHGNTTPVIMLTGKNVEQIAPWDALNEGGDDFLKKPVRIEELMARINAVYRRSQHQSQKDSNLIQYGDIKIDLHTNQVFYGERKIYLRKTLFLLLLRFLKEPEKIIRYEDFIEYIWGQTSLLDSDTMRSLRVHMCHLKKALDNPSQKFISNIHGQGYIFREKDLSTREWIIK